MKQIIKLLTTIYDYSDKNTFASIELMKKEGLDEYIIKKAEKRKLISGNRDNYILTNEGYLLLQQHLSIEAIKNTNIAIKNMDESSTKLNKEMLKYSEESSKLNTKMLKHTNTMTKLTVAIFILTLINIFIVLIPYTIKLLEGVIQ